MYIHMPTQYQPKEILKKYNEEIDGVKKDAIVLGKCDVSLMLLLAPKIATYMG